MEATFKLQSGVKGYRALWKQIIKISVADMKRNYDNLNVTFDLWKGESDVHDVIPGMVDYMKKEGYAYISDGALVVDVKEDTDTKEIPPCMILKSDGASLYNTTDLATIMERMREYHPDQMIYLTDKRQDLYFEQVFRCARKTKLVDEDTELVHIGFGTVNGADGHAFKTRDGGVMNLEDMIKISKDKVRESIPEPSAEYDAAYIEKLVGQIAVGAMKFQDLKNNIASGYVFEIDDFAKFEGKTGPYIQYAIARINSILRKAGEIKPGKIVITNPEERDLALKLMQLNNIVLRTHEAKEPSIISDYAYTLAQAFSSFYNTSPIMSAATPEQAASRLQIAKIVRDVLTLLLNLLGIEAPEVMLKKAE